MATKIGAIMSNFIFLAVFRCAFGFDPARDETHCVNGTSQLISANTSHLRLDDCNLALTQALRMTQYGSSIAIIPLTVISTILVFLGTFRHLKTNSANVYMFLLAIFDVLTIIGHKLYYFLSRHRIDLGYSLNCKLLQYTMTVFHLSSLWTLVAMTIERVYVVYKPLHATVHCRPSFAHLVTLTGVVTMLLVSLTLFWEYDLVVANIPEYRFCAVVDISLFRAMTWVRNTLQCFAPITILTVCNIAIVRALNKQRANMSQLAMRKNDSIETCQQKQIQSITITLFSVSVIYVVLTLPYAVKFILDAYWDYKSDCQSLAAYHIFNVIVYRLQDVIHCIKGYIYLLTSQKFRSEVLKWCRQRSEWRAQNTSISTVYDNADTKL